MALESLNTIKLSTDELNRFQELVNRFSLQFKNIPFLDGIAIKSDLVLGSNEITHGLGRKPVGYIITTKSANIDIWGNTFTDKKMTLESGGTVTINMWVF